MISDLFSTRVEKVLEFDYVTMLQTPHNLEFPILLSKTDVHEIKR